MYDNFFSSILILLKFLDEEWSFNLFLYHYAPYTMRRDLDTKRI